MPDPAPFAARLTRAPLPYDPEAGAEARARLSDLPSELGALIAGTAGCSPFLKGLMERHADWLRAALAGAPETALKAELAALGPAPVAETGLALRRAKGRIALLAGLADLGGVWALEAVTDALTQLADAACQRALAAALAEEIRRGRIPGAVPGDEETGAGMVAFAMGKMGAHELNYSSDIDLICLFDETRFDPSDRAEARAAFIRATRRMAATLSDHTAEGYVFRTDLRLRPDASVTPVCISMEAAERYYESLGRTWERAAWIKARPCAGDLAAGARFLDTLRPFVWRRHLDFAAIRDAHDMILRIRSHKGLTVGPSGVPSLEGLNLKLGPGGIREIEFFTQTRQLIAGGRDPDLRARDTVGGLAALAAKGWVPAEVVSELTDHYRAHREVEHRLQMVQDAQTQTLPATPQGWDRLARFCGMADTSAFRAGLTGRLGAVVGLTEAFFAPAEAAPMPDLTPAQAELVGGWSAYPALRSSRAQEIFARLLPEILGRLVRTGAGDEALISFDRFLGGLPAGVQLLSLFEANPVLLDLMADICATAPRLGAYLARNAGVFDAVIGGAFFAPWPGMAALREGLAARLGALSDYENKLDAARVWAREWHFRVGVHHLRGLTDAFEAAGQYAELAEAALAALWPEVVAEFARRHGPPPGRGAAVLAMGSLGAGRLSATSDLDLIAIYDPAGAETSEGPRPLATRAYYARLTQAFVTALTASTAEGRLYEVDMRLRPSGRQGPVATAFETFCSYQRTEAWTWEHLALTRARAVAGDPVLAAEIEAFRRTLLTEKALGEGIEADVAEMRARLRAARPAGGALEVKDGAGRLQDIDLFAQMGALRAASPARRTEAQLVAARRMGLIDPTEAATLSEAARLMWRVQATLRLLADRTTDPAELAGGARRFLLRETGAADLDALTADLAARAAAAAAIIGRRLGEGAGDAVGAEGLEPPTKAL
jgi:[glutamine synthetase] adenylyltransferase / [glutamine synthetase]-adenylyl-L-tyrosine phosphorylase